MKKLTVSTMALFWKLVTIEKKHRLRDCTEEIIWFSRFWASQLDFVSRPDMTPFNFYSEWKAALCNLAVGVPWTGKTVTTHLSRVPLEQLKMLDQKMLMFAEDLCGKEFAEEVRREHAGWGIEINPHRYLVPLYLSGWQNGPGVMPHFNLGNYLEDQSCPPERCGHLPGKVLPGLKTPTSFLPDNSNSEATAEWQKPNHSGDCHPFPPAVPVMEDESRPGDHAGFTKDGVRQPELEDSSGCHLFPPEPPVMEQEAKHETPPHRFEHQFRRNEDLDNPDCSSPEFSFFD